MGETDEGAAPHVGSGPRQLVICCDGTNNTLTGGSADTNVLKLHEYLVKHPRPGRVLFYDPGVGTPDAAPPTDLVDWIKRSGSRIAGLASGRGVYDNIADGYRFLVRNWRDNGDEIYCFGFSRGAFTARCIVGMVNLFGIVRPEHEVMLPTLVHIYFSLPSGEAHWWQGATRWLHRHTARSRKAAAEAGGHSESDDRARLANQVRELFCTPEGANAEVHWVGVWDTVESVGMPGPLSRSNPSTATLVGKRIRNVRHALALDEHRWTFVPRLYEEPGDLPDARTQSSPYPQTLKQRWFPGDHCDVGGSYKRSEAALSNHAFAWMLNEVSQALALPPVDPAAPFNNEPPARAVRHDALYDSAWWALAGMCLRDMQPKTSGDRPERIEVTLDPQPVVPPGESVWSSRRPLWPLFAAVVLGGLFLFLFGACLVDIRAHSAADAFQQAAEAAYRMASTQLEVLWRLDLASAEDHILSRGPSVCWAMFWDFAFMGAYGYLLARIGSRAFTWLAGPSRPGQPKPWWRGLGMAPLAAVGGDAVEDLATLLAIACNGLDVHWLAVGLLIAGSIGSTVKLLGAAGCAVLGAVRLWMTLGLGRSYGSVR